MKRGTDNASLFDESVGPEQQGYSSNMKLMMIVAAFLIITIGLILVQPNVAPNQLAENEPTELTKTADLASVPSADYSNSEAVVMRSETSLLSVGDRLHGLLVQALAEGQSDAYIDALLNTAVTRGDFRAPVALTMSSGRFNADVLLQELVFQFNK
mgnify:CR=1 FL=1